MSKETYPYILLHGRVNPSVLIGSFLARISTYGPFQWKRSSAVFESRQIQNKDGPSAM